MVDFELPPDVEPLHERAAVFIRQTVMPADARDHGAHGPDEALRLELQDAARAADLFASHMASELPDELRSTEHARQVGQRFVAALADIHAVEVSSGELALIGRPSGYLERQLRHFATIWAQVKTREFAAMDHLTASVGQHHPSKTHRPR